MGKDVPQILSKRIKFRTRIYLNQEKIFAKKEKKKIKEKEKKENKSV